MKRIILPAMAFVFAFAGAFVSLKANTLNDEFIQLPDGCRKIVAGCNNVGPNLCVVQSTIYAGQYTVYGSRTNPSVCANPLFHSGGIIIIN